jgi:uncharacterized protein YggE
MKKNLFLIFLLFSLISVVAQSQNSNLPFISVKGEAQKEVAPNEIYISIVIREKMEAREKISVQSQEDALKTELKAADIELSNLNVAIESATLRRYVLRVSNVANTVQVFNIVEKLNLYDANITKVGHSEMKQYVKETQIAAIQAAKEKATYLLGAIEEQIGRAIVVEEGDNGVNISYSLEKDRNRYEKGAKSYPNKEELEFVKITIEVSIKAKFEILQKN